MKFELSENITNQLNALNTKGNELAGYTANDINDWLRDLQKNGTTLVGYRSSCGSTDKTQKIYRLWLKAVKILSKNGIQLKEENIKINNPYATLSGGFWQEVRYFLA